MASIKPGWLFHAYDLIVLVMESDFFSSCVIEEDCCAFDEFAICFFTHNEFFTLVGRDIEGCDHISQADAPYPVIFERNRGGIRFHLFHLRRGNLDDFIYHAGPLYEGIQAMSQAGFGAVCQLPIRSFYHLEGSILPGFQIPQDDFVP